MKNLRREHVREQHLYEDKYALARDLGYYCGLEVPRDIRPGKYIVRPRVNPYGMGLGVKIEETRFYPDDRFSVPKGHFWCEYFKGVHYSVDYIYGQQAHEYTFLGEKYDDVHFKSWKRARIDFPLPEIIRDLERLEQLNCEYIGDKLIEVNLRGNEDGWDEEMQELRPVWSGMVLEHPGQGWVFIHNEDQTDTRFRLGFWAKYYIGLARADAFGPPSDPKNRRLAK